MKKYIQKLLSLFKKEKKIEPKPFDEMEIAEEEFAKGNGFFGRYE